MKLIIDIDENTYRQAKEENDYEVIYNGYEMARAIINGTPVSNKGDLISREDLKSALKSNCKPEICHDFGTNWCEACCPHNDFEDLIDNAPTISSYKAIHDELHKGEEE